MERSSRSRSGAIRIDFGRRWMMRSPPSQPQPPRNIPPVTSTSAYNGLSLLPQHQHAVLAVEVAQDLRIFKSLELLSHLHRRGTLIEHDLQIHASTWHEVLGSVGEDSPVERQPVWATIQG